VHMDQTRGLLARDVVWNIFYGSYITSIWGRYDLACVYV